MRLQNYAAMLLLAGATTFLVSCGGTESTAADEAAIKDANKKWMELIVKKDAKAIATEIYSEAGVFLPPGAPRVVGREAVEKAWADMANIPGVALTFETDSGVVVFQMVTSEFPCILCMVLDTSAVLGRVLWAAAEVGTEMNKA